LQHAMYALDALRTAYQCGVGEGKAVGSDRSPELGSGVLHVGSSQRTINRYRQSKRPRINCDETQIQNARSRISTPAKQSNRPANVKSKPVLAHTNCTSSAEKRWTLEDWLQAESETFQANLEIVVASKVLLQSEFLVHVWRPDAAEGGNRAFWPYVALAIRSSGRAS